MYNTPTAVAQANSTIGAQTSRGAGIAGNAIDAKTSALSELTHELDGLCANFSELRNRMTGFRARTVGAPPSGKEEGLKPVSNGLIGQIADKIQCLKNLANDMYAEMNHIENVG